MNSRMMTFKELAFRIHPDHNPGIEDAGGKMNQAILVKNQPEELYKLAVRWGVTDLQQFRPQPSQTPKPEPVQPVRQPEPETQVRYGWVQYVNADPQVGDHVRIITRDSVQVKVTRTTPKRVYFYENGERHYALKRCVYVVRWEPVQ